MIRRASAADLPAILAIEARCHLRPWARDDFEAELAAEDGRSLFFVTGGPIEAYVIAWRVAGEIQIQNVTTAPEARRRGHARRLLEHVLSFTHDFAALEVRPDNGAARALYEALGFVEVGRRPRFYSNGDAALLMQRSPRP